MVGKLALCFSIKVEKRDEIFRLRNHILPLQTLVKWNKKATPTLLHYLKITSYSQW